MVFPLENVMNACTIRNTLADQKEKKTKKLSLLKIQILFSVCSLNNKSQRIESNFSISLGYLHLNRLQNTFAKSR